MNSMLRAYEDIDFLKSADCRSVRLQLEFLKPETILQNAGIEGSIVIFGSARIPSADLATKKLKDAEKALASDPTSNELDFLATKARHMVSLSHYYELARSFAKLVTEKSRESKNVVCTGGGGGIMEAGNRGASEADGKSIGLNINLPFEQNPNPYITEGLSFNFHYFSIRKMHFLKRAKALCAFPGGFGTMDELFEALTLMQTGKIPKMPVVLFGREFWDDFMSLDALVERGLISPKDLELFSFCDTPEEAWEYIENFWKDNNK